MKPVVMTSAYRNLQLRKIILKNATAEFFSAEMQTLIPSVVREFAEILFAATIFSNSKRCFACHSYTLLL